MHPREDACPFQGCGRDQFFRLEDLALHCWHVHGMSAFDDDAAVQCTENGCENLKFECATDLHEHLQLVHNLPPEDAESARRRLEQNRYRRRERFCQRDLPPCFVIKRYLTPLTGRGAVEANAVAMAVDNDAMTLANDEEGDREDQYEEYDWHRTNGKRARHNGHLEGE